MYPELEMNTAELLDKWLSLSKPGVATDVEWGSWINALPLLESGWMPTEVLIGIPDRYTKEENALNPEDKIEQLANVVRTSMWWSFFNEYIISKFAIETDLVWYQDVIKSQERLLALDPDPVWIDIYRWWYDTQHPSIEKDKIVERWEASIYQLAETAYASKMAEFVNCIKPEDTRKRLEKALQNVPELPVTLLSDLLPARKSSNQKFGDTERDEDTYKLSGYYDDLSNVCSIARKLGHADLVEPHHNYLLRTVETIDMNNVDEFSVYRLIRYYLRSDVSHGRKVSLTNKIDREVNFHRNRLINEIFIDLLLEIGDFDRACEEIHYLPEPSFYHAFSGIIYHCVKTDNLPKARQIQEEWLDQQMVGKENQNNQRAINMSNLEIWQSWSWAARKLLKEGIDIYNQPEVVLYFNIDFSLSLDDLSRLTSFTGDLTNIITLLESHISRNLRLYHDEGLSDEDYRKLLEAIIRFKLIENKSKKQL